jgi:hypothetical protein
MVTSPMVLYLPHILSPSASLHRALRQGNEPVLETFAAHHEAGIQIADLQENSASSRRRPSE